MIIDIHGHTSAPQALYGFNFRMMTSRGDFGRSAPTFSNDEIVDVMQPHMAMLDEVGTDLQFIMPRPWGIPNGHRHEKTVRWMTEEVNTLIARQVALFPGRLLGIAGLPQVDQISPANCAGELDRAVKELGLKGCMINPDPGEGGNTTPPMGDEFWYPLYEKLCELDIPGMIHTGNSANGRVTQSEHLINEEAVAGLSILRSTVFRDFPTLKLIIPHGGGWIPYQIGRFRGSRAYLKGGSKALETFDDALRQLYFDTVVYNQEALDLLLKIVGPANCLFGTDRPAVASKRRDPDTGRQLDDIKPLVEASAQIDDAGRAAVFSANAKRLFMIDAKGG